MTPSIDLTPFMALQCFEDIKMYFPQAFSEYDPWYMLSALISDFHFNRQKKVAASVVKILDESMSAWRSRKDKTGGLPNISFTLQKPEPLGHSSKPWHAL